ncbi:AbrB/MazE/SpoVT family DNA-binding domain-containing protein [Secundilactobacillus muriivasis]
MQTKIKKWGNSQGIMISKQLLTQIGIEHPIDQDIELSVKGNQLIIEKASNESKLDKLFEGFDSDKYFSENKGKLEYDWGESAGKEVW